MVCPGPCFTGRPAQIAEAAQNQVEFVALIAGTGICRNTPVSICTRKI